jgi:hypothetical protein
MIAMVLVDLSRGVAYFFGRSARSPARVLVTGDRELSAPTPNPQMIAASPAAINIKEPRSHTPETGAIFCGISDPVAGAVGARWGELLGFGGQRP